MNCTSTSASMTHVPAASIPSIEWPSPTVNCVRSALDDASCRIERLRALYRSNLQDMHEHLVTPPDDMPKRYADLICSIWMIFELADEKLEEVDKLIAAITSAANSSADFRRQRGEA